MPRRRKHREEWTLEKVVAEIAKLDALGDDLNPLRLSKEGYAGLIAAARQHVGSWHDACRLAGALDHQGRQRWSRQKIIARLRRLQADGHHMSILALQRSGHYDLAQASARSFGTWSAACKKAGVAVAPQGNRTWTRKRILGELRRLASLGLDMRPRRLIRSGHRDVVKAAERYLGDWAQALQLAGVPDPRTPWTKQRVIETILQRHEQGASLSTKVVALEKRGPTLMWAARKYCGGWPTAVKTAGLTPANVPTWTKETVSTELLRLANSGIRMSSSALAKEGHGDVVAGAQRRYGTWPAALRAVGIARPSPRWSKQLVIETIRARHERGDSLSSRALEREKGGRGLMCAAAKFCGTWVKAVKLAGLTPASAPMWTKKKVVSELRRLASSGLWMSSSDLRQAGHVGVVGAAKRLYGTWAAALRSARIPRPKRRKPRSRLG